MGIRERAMASASRKSVHVDIPEWQDGDDPIAPNGVLVRELNVEQRNAALAKMANFDTDGSGTMTIPLAVIAPFITDLVLDPISKTPAFEPADRDYLLTEHPTAVSRVLMKAFTMSEIGASAVERAEGN
jgi:hypothetical protein